MVFARPRYPFDYNANRGVMKPRCIRYFLEGVPVDTNGLGRMGSGLFIWSLRESGDTIPTPRISKCTISNRPASNRWQGIRDSPGVFNNHS